MSEFRCIHCWGKFDYEYVYENDSIMVMPEESTNADFNWNTLNEYWKHELKAAELDKENIEGSDYQYMICKYCDKEREETRRRDEDG